MAKFIYRMQSILDIKLKLESQARMEFAKAKQIQNEEEEKLEKLEGRKEHYIEEARTFRNNALSVRQLRDSKIAIQTMDDFIAEQQKRIQAAEEKTEAAREKLKEVMQERKTHEKLKEKSFEDFRMEENQKESKEVDELISYTYGQKRMENQ